MKNFCRILTGSFLPAVCFVYIISLSGCSGLSLSKEENPKTETSEQFSETEPVILVDKDNGAVNQETDTEEAPEKAEEEKAEEKTEDESEEEPWILDFVDVFGEHYLTEILPDVEKHDYINECFTHSGDKLSYEGDDRYKYRLGVDVSHHQGSIDWEKVRAQGYEFAFLRIGYRGYGSAGVLGADREFESNYKKAVNAGLDVGVYFFAQAVNEEEALEEADFVLKLLDGKELQLPVVYDPESILDDVARTDDVSGEQFTKNTRVFADRIRDAGYEPMIYNNMLWEAFEFDLSQLRDLEIWYADYELLPQTPYHFSFWQYSNEGRVDGISGVCDLDIELRKVE